MQNSIFNKYLERVEKLQKTLPPLQERFNIINEISEEYYLETGEQLPAFIIEMLGTWYLKEVYSDKRTNKVIVEEFPILTESQILRRRRKVVQIEHSETLETLNYHLRNNSSTSRRIEKDKSERDEIDVYQY